MASSNDSESRNLLTAIDLFSGCGGLTLGLKQAGFRVLGAVEAEPLRRRDVQVKSRKQVEVGSKDIRKLTLAEVKRRLGLEKGDLDLLAGCPPCQGFSSMRTLNGGRPVEDDRNNLVFEFLFVKGLNPKTIMMENVPGSASDERMMEVEAELTRMGYVWDVPGTSTSPITGFPNNAGG